MMIFEPGDLPFIGTGVNPDHEELVVLLREDFMSLLFLCAYNHPFGLEG